MADARALSDKTESVLPSRHISRVDTVEPMLTKLRMDSAEPLRKAPNTDPIELPAEPLCWGHYAQNWRRWLRPCTMVELDRWLGGALPHWPDEMPDRDEMPDAGLSFDR